MKGFTIENEVKRLKDEVFFLRLDSAVRVEGPDDKPFWEATFKAAVPQHKIRIFAESNYPTAGSTGKSNVLKFKRFADKELLPCVDADYDYLLQSKSIIGVKYVFHTYAFSIENFICNPAALQAIYLDAGGNADGAPDFEGFFKTYSNIIHPLLLLSVYSEKEKDGICGLKKCGSEACPTPDWILELSVDELLEKMRQRIEEQVSDIQSKLIISENESWQKQLHDVGATPENTCWFVRGHNWIEFIVQFVAIVVLRSNKIAEETVKPISDNELVLFADTVEKTKALLRNHSYYSDGVFFERILGDLHNFISQPTNN